MKKIGSLFILVCFISCSRNDNNKPVFNELQLTPIDTTIIIEGKTMLGEVLERHIQGQYLVVKDSSHPFYSLFNITSGLPLHEYNNENVEGVVFPNTSPDGFYISGDSVFILYSWVNKVFLLTKGGKHLKTIKLNYPEPEKLTSETLIGGIFTYDPRKNIFLVKSKYPIVGNSPFKYSKSSIITTFDINGNFINSFGSYPKPYTKGKMDNASFNAICINDFVYVLFSTAYPYIEKYNLAGNLVATIPNKGLKFDYNIKYYKGEFDPYTIEGNDNYFNFAMDNSHGNQIFYMDYVALQGKTMLSKSKRYLLKHNVIENTYTEVQIPHDLRLVNVKNDTIYMYNDSNELNKLLLIKYLLK